MKDTLSNQRPKFATVYHFAIGKLTPIAMACYVVLCKYADNEKHDAFPGHAKIATVEKMWRSSVKRALAELVSEKLVSIRKMGRKGQEHNHYTLLFPASIQARTGGMVPTEPGVSQNRGRSPQSPELGSGYLDSETKNKKHGVVDTTSVSNSLSSKRVRRQQVALGTRQRKLEGSSGSGRHESCRVRSRSSQRTGGCRMNPCRFGNVLHDNLTVRLGENSTGSSVVAVSNTDAGLVLLIFCLDFFGRRGTHRVARRECRSMSRADTHDDYAIRAAVEAQARRQDPESIASEPRFPELSHSDDDVEGIRVLWYLVDQHPDDERAIALGLYEYSEHGKLPPGFKTRVQ